MTQREHKKVNSSTQSKQDGYDFNLSEHSVITDAEKKLSIPNKFQATSVKIGSNELHLRLHQIASERSLGLDPEAQDKIKEEALEFLTPENMALINNTTKGNDSPQNEDINLNHLTIEESTLVSLEVDVLNIPDLDQITEHFCEVPAGKQAIYKMIIMGRIDSKDGATNELSISFADGRNFKNSQSGIQLSLIHI